MTFLWTNTALLAFAGLVLAPLAAHLFAKARPPERRFASLQWLRQVERRTARLRRPKDWMLLVLRTLAVCALLAAFLQPLLLSRQNLAGAGETKTLVLVVDRSASMSASADGQTHLMRASSLAADTLQQAGGNTQANIIWLDAYPDTVYPEPGVNVQPLIDTLQRATVSHEAADTKAAFQKAVEQLGKGSGSKELYLFSDFQRSAWKDLKLDVPANVKIFKVGVNGKHLENAAITSLTTEPSVPVAGTEVLVRCRARNFSAREKATTLFLQAGDSRFSRPVTLPADGEITVEFRTSCPMSGIMPFKANLAEDAFPADDARYAVVEVRDPVRTILLTGATAIEEASVWERVINSFSWMTRSPIENAELIIALQPDSSAIPGLEAAAERGALVVLQPGPQSQIRDSTQPDTLEQLKKEDTPWKISMSDEKHPVWKLFAGGQFGDPAAGSFRKRIRPAAELTGAGNLLLSYRDGVPALQAQAMGKGHVLRWNLYAGTPATDWTSQPSFLPMVGELLKAHLPTGNAVLREMPPGAPLIWQTPQPLQEAQVRLENDAGELLKITSSDGGSTWSHSASLSPGLFRWVVDGQTIERAAINFPAEESDLELMPSDIISFGESIPTSAGAALAMHRDGVPLWPWFLGLAVIALMSESILSLQRRTPEEPA